MQVHRNIDDLPLFHKAVITIGTFDGVHLGHQRIIHQMKTEASICGGETVILTFHPHPRKVVNGSKHKISLLNSLEEKIELLGTHGIDHLVVIPFTDQFSKMSAREYVSRFLVGRFHPYKLIIGYDHRFGNDRMGNYELLEEMGPGLGFSVCEIPEHIINSLTVSSTNIRKALLAGKLEEANKYLGYPYMLSGTVVHGDKIGRTMGFPTANLEVTDGEKLIPANGVYAVRVQAGPHGMIHKGMMNIGVRPTLDGNRRIIEVNIFDYSGNLYSEHLRISLYHYIRAEKKFSSMDELRNQIIKDKEDISSLMN
jgi:riboflavin kinase/FMN adenylyltransferase